MLMITLRDFSYFEADSVEAASASTELEVERTSMMIHP